MRDLAARSLRPLLLATALACPLFLLGLWLDSFSLRLPAKPWIHLALLAWILSKARGRYARTIAVAISLCMAADLLLEFRETHFAKGIAVFLAAQLTLAFAFWRRCGELRPLAALPFVFWLGLACAKLLPGMGSLRAAVLAYMFAIGLMMWRAAVCFVVSDARPAARAASRYALFGAVVFGLSDSLIAFDRFDAPVPGARYWIILTYWSALALLAASAVKSSEE